MTTPADAPQTFLHVALPAAWAHPPYDGRGNDAFIHCCQPHQLRGVLERWFDGHNQVIVLALSVPGHVDVRWVCPYADGDAFPHVHAEFDPTWVIREWTIERHAGDFQIDDEVLQ